MTDAYMINAWCVRPFITVCDVEAPTPEKAVTIVCRRGAYPAAADDEKAQRLYQEFKFKVVGRLPHDRWELSQEDIRQAVAQIEATREPGRG